MNIVIADDHELFLKGLELVLKMHYPDALIETARDYNELFSALRRKTFDLVITDLAMPGAKPLEALSKIHALIKDTPLIVISAVFDREIIQKTIDIGVSGYIPKSTSNQLILGAINLVLAGGVYIPRELIDEAALNMVDSGFTKEVQKLKQLDDAERQTGKKLTQRQIDILKLVAQGLSNKQIAYQLGLTEGTVKVHITIILKTLDVANRTGAVTEAVKRGYLSQNEVGG